MVQARYETKSRPLAAVPDLHQGEQDLLTATKPSKMTFDRQVKQLGIRPPGNDVLPMGKRNEMVVVVVPRLSPHLALKPQW